MRKITEIIIHCSATTEGKDFTVEDIDRWHRQRGFNGIGYHFVIYRDGSIHAGRSKRQIGAHCKGHNTISIGICYIGGLSTDGKPKDTRTAAQKASLHALVEQLQEEFPSPPFTATTSSPPKPVPASTYKRNLVETLNLC